MATMVLWNAGGVSLNKEVEWRKWFSGTQGPTPQTRARARVRLTTRLARARVRPKTRAQVRPSCACAREPKNACAREAQTVDDPVKTFMGLSEKGWHHA